MCMNIEERWPPHGNGNGTKMKERLYLCKIIRES